MKLSQLSTPERRAERQLMKLGGYAFHRMKLYMNSMRGDLRFRKARIESYYEDIMEKYPEHGQMLDEQLIQDLEDNEKHFVGLLLNSAMVMSAAIFENMFKKVCHFAAYKTHKKFEEPRMHVIVNCQKFIASLGVDLGKISDEFQIVNAGLLVRHLITHHGATINEKTAKRPQDVEAIKHIKSTASILIRRPKSKGPKEFYIKDQIYVIEFIDWCRDYLTWIIMNLPERRPKMPRNKVPSKRQQVDG